MSKPSELLAHIEEALERINDWPPADIDAAQANRVEQQLRDADRLLWEAVEALDEAELSP